MQSLTLRALMIKGSSIKDQSAPQALKYQRQETHSGNAWRRQGRPANAK